MKCVCLGDSLTFGYGVDRPYRWCELVKTSLNIEVINRGVNGDTTSGMLSRSYKDIIKNSPTHAIIMGGTNDFLSGKSSKYVFNNLSFLIEECKSNNIIPIIAIEPFAYDEMAKLLWDENVDYEAVNKRIGEYRSIMLSYASNNNIVCIDFYEAFSKLAASDLRKFFIDGIHLSSEGHKLMSSLVCHTFKTSVLLP